MNACPKGYEKISNPEVCEIATRHLYSYIYSDKNNDDKSDSVCNLCKSCEPSKNNPRIHTYTSVTSKKVTNSQGSRANLVCKQISGND